MRRRLLNSAKVKNNPDLIKTHEAYIALTTRPVDYFNTESSVNATKERPCDNFGDDRTCKGVITYDKLLTLNGKLPMHLVVRNQG